MIAIVKYNAGNITSVENALQRLGYDCVITDDAEILRKAKKVIFPGVGEASTAMKYLREKELDKVIKTLTQPVLGICLGQQLMCNHSEENNTICMGIFNADVKLFPATDIVPHMGWNNVTKTKGRLFDGLDIDDNFYPAVAPAHLVALGHVALRVPRAGTGGGVAGRAWRCRADS